MSLLKWIWGLLKKVFNYLSVGVRFILEIFSSILTWIIGGIAFVVHLGMQYLGDFFVDLFSDLESLSIGTLQTNALAQWLARDLLALNVAWECLILYFSVWVAARVARGGWTVFRFVLDVI